MHEHSYESLLSLSSFFLAQSIQQLASSTTRAIPTARLVSFAGPRVSSTSSSSLNDESSPAKSLLTIINSPKRRSKFLVIAAPRNAENSSTESVVGRYTRLMTLVEWRAIPTPRRCLYVRDRPIQACLCNNAIWWNKRRREGNNFASSNAKYFSYSPLFNFVRVGWRRIVSDRDKGETRRVFVVILGGGPQPVN